MRSVARWGTETEETITKKYLPLVSKDHLAFKDIMIDPDSKHQSIRKNCNAFAKVSVTSSVPNSRVTIVGMDQ